MIGTSFTEYLLIRTCISALRAIAPLSFAYWLCRPFIPAWRGQAFLDIWSATEIPFFLLLYLPLRHRSQKKAIHPPLPSESERKRLHARCHDTINDPEQYVRKWFKDAPLADIQHENVKDFFAWAFFNTDRVAHDHESEIEGYVTGLESQLARRFERGSGKAQPIKMTLDAVSMVHRPFVWYMIVGLVDISTSCMFLYMGFRFHHPRTGFFPTTFPVRPQTLLGSKLSPTRTMSYWYKPHTSTTKLPILLIHGIGIGLLTYVPFLAELNKGWNSEVDGDIGVIALELLPISFRITHSALETEQMCREIHAILVKHDYQKFVLVSHSYGSVITTHLLKSELTSSKIAAVVLVDPVSFLLHLPDVAYNFVHRPPRRANEWQLWYFASMDMGVSHTLARGFFWSENILWKEDLAGRGTTVFLAGRDLIVNVRAVAEYLNHDPSDTAGPDTPVRIDRAERSDIEVVWSEELDHASIFDSPTRRQMLVKALYEQFKSIIAPTKLLIVPRSYDTRTPLATAQSHQHERLLPRHDPAEQICTAPSHAALVDEQTTLAAPNDIKALADMTFASDEPKASKSMTALTWSTAGRMGREKTSLLPLWPSLISDR